MMEAPSPARRGRAWARRRRGRGLPGISTVLAPFQARSSGGRHIFEHFIVSNVGVKID